MDTNIKTDTKETTDPALDMLDYKMGLISQETETRMRIAELAAQLLQITAPGTGTMITYMSIYRELSNEILDTLLTAKTNVVPELQQ